MAVPTGTGYPLKWFRDHDLAEDTYQCAVCQDVAKDVMQVRGCGHQFCRQCLDGVLRSCSAKCPTCRKDISRNMVFDDMGANRAIGKLKVNCPNKGCVWVGSLNSFIQEHNKACLFITQNCSNKGCNVQVIRRDLRQHLTRCQHRTISCDHCRANHLFKDRNKHQNTCQKLPVRCTNNCWKIIPRNEMAEHLTKDCPNTSIECKYSDLGCDHKCLRREMEQHLQQNVKEHLDLSSLEISKLRSKVNQTGTSIIKITDFNEKLLKAKDNTPGRFPGDPFFTSSLGFKMKMTVGLNDTRKEFRDHMGVYINLMKSDHDAILLWPFEKKCTFTLIDQHDEEGERKNIVQLLTPKGEDQFKRPTSEENVLIGFAGFVSHTILKTRKYIKDDTVFLTLRVE